VPRRAPRKPASALGTGTPAPRLPGAVCTPQRRRQPCRQRRPGGACPGGDPPRLHNHPGTPNRLRRPLQKNPSNLGVSKLSSPTALRDAARALLHSLDPVIWAADVLKFTCDSWQAALLRSSHPQIVLRCSRQSGKTAVTAILAAHQAIFTPNSLVLVTSPSLRQASETSGKIRALVITAGIRLAADAATSITLPNGSRVVSLPASPDAIRGYSAPRLVIEDEAVSLSTVFDVKSGQTEHGIWRFAIRSHHRTCA
jgi:Terminase large subunit, T4likevirus-type, N-terminal